MQPTLLKLVILKGPRSGETLEFRPGSTVRVGRVVRGNDVAIRDPGVSSKHLIINFDSGKWLVQDLDSSNGTGINSNPIPPFSPFELHDNDTIELGECSSMLVRVQDESPGKGEEEAPSEVMEAKRPRARPKRAGAASEKANVSSAAKVEEISVRVTRSRKNIGLGLERAEVGVGKRTRGNVRGLPPRPEREAEKEEEEERVEEKGGRKPSENVVVVKEERVEFEVEEEGERVEVNAGLDWEKATLGEWFDLMEEHLRKQVVEASEAMIDEMRRKAVRVCEYLLERGQGKDVAMAEV